MNSKDLISAVMSMVLVVIGTILLFYIGKTFLSFLLAHWLTVSILVISAVIFTLFLILKDGDKTDARSSKSR